MMKKVSILMPTYNDAKHIKKSIDSVFEQNYSNWELLICDDGSTDDTKEIIAEYKEKKDKSNKIIYIYQDNSDQLNAIINTLSYAKGDYIYILHSDDLLFDKNTIYKMVNYMEKNKKVDSIIANIPLINEAGNNLSIQKVLNYKKNNNTIALQLLWLGRNLYVDMAFHRKEIFKKQVYNNYLKWNGPFWLDLDNNSMLNVEKVNFPFFKYRICDDNYLSANGANLNVINGEIRVVTRLLKYYRIPFYSIQYVIFRLLNKVGLGSNYHVIYQKKETKKKDKIIYFVLKKRFTDKEIINNKLLNSILCFYKNDNNRIIEINNIDNNIKWYYGKDIRIFNRDLEKNTIDDIYKTILKEMKKGFSKIIIFDKNYYEKIVDLTKFLCIYPNVEVIVRSKKNEKN